MAATECVRPPPSLFWTYRDIYYMFAYNHCHIGTTYIFVNKKYLSSSWKGIFYFRKLIELLEIFDPISQTLSPNL